MRQVADELFLQQSAQFALRASCDDCAHFDPDSERCAEGYPNHEHRHLPVSAGQNLCFCKMFELA